MPKCRLGKYCLSVGESGIPGGALVLSEVEGLLKAPSSESFCFWVLAEEIPILGCGCAAVDLRRFVEQVRFCNGDQE
jgi:hypothetical protein